MFDAGIFEEISRSGFRYRAKFMKDGSVVYRTAGRHCFVRLPREDWNRLIEAFETSMTPIRRRTLIASFVHYPMALFGLIFLSFILFWMPPIAGPVPALFILGVVFGTPIFIFLRHFNVVRRRSKDLEQLLLRYPETEPFLRSVKKPPRIVDVLLIILFGPSLFIAVVGEIGGPDYFRNTPLVGAGIGTTEYVIFALVALRLAGPYFAKSLLRT